MEDTSKIVITGSNGQLGTELKRLLGDKAIAVSHRELDITERDSVEHFVRTVKPSVIVNCAAYTSVDKAESDAEACYAVNARGPELLARALVEHGGRLVHVSTDYVFDGHAYRPYTENDTPAPASVYGKSKLLGEEALKAHLPSATIVRTGWLYSPFGRNFVKTMLSLAAGGVNPRVVADQTGTPTCAADLAQVLANIALRQEDMPGIFHFANEGVTSWYDFAVAVFEDGGYDATGITPVTTADYPTAARRPFYSVLNKSKIKDALGITIPHWRDSLRRTLKRTI